MFIVYNDYILFMESEVISMEAVSWSVDLRQLVKGFKKMELASNGNASVANTIMNSISLSAMEKQLAANEFANKKPASPRLGWT
jgi:hypothetical protein